MLIISNRYDMYNIFAGVSLISVGLINYLLFNKFHKFSSLYLSINLRKEFLEDRSYIFIVIFNLVICIVNLYLIQKNIDFSELNKQTGLNTNFLFASVGIFSIIMGQFGGWIFQTVLLFLCLNLFNEDVTFKKCFKITGVSYLGFVISSTLICYYIGFLGEINDFNQLGADKNLFIMLIGKFGEFLTIALIYKFILNLIKVKKNALIISSLPSVLIILSVEFFNYFK